MSASVETLPSEPVPWTLVYSQEGDATDDGGRYSWVKHLVGVAPSPDQYISMIVPFDLLVILS